jgi:alcohol dehydrogenase class IV
MAEFKTGYLAPRQVIAGLGAAGKCGPALSSWGVPPGPVMVVADRVVAAVGLTEPLVRGLESAGFTPEVFDQIAGEPDVAVVTDAAERARAIGALAVVGIGGGSAMDAAKVVALLTTNKGGVADWLGPVAPPHPVAPLVLAPTTTGTGSEATAISMVTVNGAKRAVSCPQFVPLIAVLDGELVAGLPGRVVASTGMDALAHGVESMLSTNRSPFTIACATEAVQLVVNQLERAADGDPQARTQMLYGAHLAGIALNAGVVVGHSIAYVVARHAPMPHGDSCALALPYCLAYSRGVPPEVSGHIAQAVTLGASSSLKDASDMIDALTGRLDLPRSLLDRGLAECPADQMASELMTEYPRPNSPVPIEAASLRSLFLNLHNGDLAAVWA